MNKRTLVLPLLLAVAAICGIYIGKMSNSVNQPKYNVVIPDDGTNPNAEQNIEDESELEFLLGEQIRDIIGASNNKLQTVLSIIHAYYVDNVHTDTIVEKVIPQLLEELDPHSVYIPAKDLQRVDQELESDFGGVGVQFSIMRDTVNVVAVVAGGPASLLGVMPGDKIIKVNGHDFVGSMLNNDMVMDSLRGTIGTTVDVTVLRGGESTIDYTITRGVIPMYSVDVSYMIEPTIGYIKIDRFAIRTYEEMVSAIAKLKNDDCQTLIVDLRGNSGGYLDVAIRMCNEFLPKDALIVYTEGAHQSRSISLADGRGVCQDMNVIVLIDEFSASASEIFSGAMQDNDRGTIVGRRSFGKGLVQVQLPLGDGSAMRLTIARYYTPSGRCIQRPYGHGTSEYYEELSVRYDHGELFDADSMQLDESQIFYTNNGRPVYGGGGIVPDIFVPRDSTHASQYLYKLRAKTLIYNFAVDYANGRRKAYADLDFDNMLSKLSNDNIYAQLTTYAARNGLPKQSVSSYEREIIECETKAYIARNLRDDEAFYRIINTMDKGIIAAIEAARSTD